MNTPFDMNALRSLSPASDEIAYDLAVQQFRDWCLEVPIDGPTHFVLTIGQFDRCFRNWTASPMTDEDYADVATITNHTNLPMDGNPYHRISIVLLDATNSVPSKVASFGVMPPEIADGTVSADEYPREGWGGDEARGSLNFTMVNGAVEAQAQNLAAFFQQNALGCYGSDLDGFVTDCITLGVSADMIDGLLERFYLLGHLSMNLLESEFAGETSDDMVRALHELMTSQHEMMLAEANEIVAEVRRRIQEGA